MVEVFNFKLESAERSPYKVSDHQKGMALAQIAREAISKELVLPYIREEMKKEDPQLSAKAFIKYTTEHVYNPNYAFMQNATTDPLDSLFLF